MFECGVFNQLLDILTTPGGHQRLQIIRFLHKSLYLNTSLLKEIILLLIRDLLLTQIFSSAPRLIDTPTTPTSGTSRIYKVVVGMTEEYSHKHQDHGNSGRKKTCQDVARIFEVN